VRTEAWPDPVNAEELHDALLWLGCLTDGEARAVPEWNGWLTALANDNRVTQLHALQATLWVAAERLRQFQTLWPDVRGQPDVLPLPDQRAWSRDEALAEILRGRLEGLGPVTAGTLAGPLGLEPDAIGAALVALEVEGFALRGRFTPGSNAEEWCDRRLLARIHHYTVRRLRAEIEPVAAKDFLRFLFAWQRVTDETRLEGPDALPAAVALLEGFEAPASAWETEILPARIASYEPTWLDDMCLAGRVAWARAWSQPQPRACRDARAYDADHAAGAPARRVLDYTCRPSERCAAESEGAGGARVSTNAGRIILRRVGRGKRSASPTSGGSTWRTRLPRGGDVG
jgi:ATP-dependent Lhr-like helicase